MKCPNVCTMLSIQFERSFDYTPRSIIIIKSSIMHQFYYEHTCFALSNPTDRFLRLFTRILELIVGFVIWMLFCSLHCPSGHRVGRMLGALFHQQPFFKGRRVCTFHNQRDFIFFRHHRYVFSASAKKKVVLQELGPQFCLKLRWLQHGTFDTKQGEFEWMHKNEMDTSRKRFFL